MSTFPSLIITAKGFIPRGDYARNTATFLHPDQNTVAELEAALKRTNTGIVAHFYMDPEVQGVLTATKWPHIQISDSLAMADKAVEMARAGIEKIVVLGVDFMSENVRAVLDASGHADVEVYRLAKEQIGCSLAESADTPAYLAWLHNAAQSKRALHVVYINTSLKTKAKSHSIVPTITCTSSNVVSTILTAFDQIEDLEVYYGPDAYMGANLKRLFTRLSKMSPERIESLYPGQSKTSLARALQHLHIYDQGICIVHHMFGAEVVRRLRSEHPDALYTAHLEVPGEMFALASDAAAEGRGVVGSTSNILAFIEDRVQQAMNTGKTGIIPIVLGTEAGMITSIVDRVSERLRDCTIEGLGVEIIFPVSSDAIATDPESPLAFVPGVAAGEGCSAEGGCASCPYMKMNSLDALFELLKDREADGASAVLDYRPEKYQEEINGQTIANLGGEPILHMRWFQRTRNMPDALVDQICRQ